MTAKKVETRHTKGGQEQAKQPHPGGQEIRVRVGPTRRAKSRFREVEKQAKAVSRKPSGKDKWAGYTQLAQPLWNAESLAWWVEASTWHWSCCDQKAHDVAGLGWSLRPTTDKPSEKNKELVQRFFKYCSPEGPFRDLLYKAQFDFEAIGWLAIEVARNQKGEVTELWHVPAHEVRVHKEKPICCQMQGGQAVAWFKRLGEKKDYSRETGEESEKLGPENRANEMIFLSGYSPRSSYYGQPPALSCLRALVGDIYAQEYNLAFFKYSAEPAYVVIIEGGDLPQEVEDELISYIESLKQQPHRVMTISLPPGVTVRFEKIGPTERDASFEQFEERNQRKILAAHKVPPYRLGIAETGSLGGSVAKETTEIYKASVVKPRQERLEKELNKLIEVGLGVEDWEFKFDEIDTEDESEDIQNTERLFRIGAVTPNEVRRRLDLGDEYPGGESYYVPSTFVAMGSTQKALEKQVAVATRRTTEDSE